MTLFSYHEIIVELS